MGGKKLLTRGYEKTRSLKVTKSITLDSSKYGKGKRTQGKLGKADISGGQRYELTRGSLVPKTGGSRAGGCTIEEKGNQGLADVKRS